MPEQYYINQLYPLQDKILHVLAQKGLSFYLTGGTVLSRSYLHHRYSDDLDFFLNNSPDFRKETSLAVETIKQSCNKVEIALADENFLRLFLVDNNVTLKVEFINDVTFHAGEIIATPLYYRTDNKENILSNKISALSRNEEKDIADILFLSMDFDFSWPEIISFAKEKDMWVNELDVSKHIHDFEISRLENVKWIKRPVIEHLNDLRLKISRDILNAANNISASNKI